MCIVPVAKTIRIQVLLCGMLQLLQRRECIVARRGAIACGGIAVGRHVSINRHVRHLPSIGHIVHHVDGASVACAQPLHHAGDAADVIVG